MGIFQLEKKIIWKKNIKFFINQNLALKKQEKYGITLQTTQSGVTIDIPQKLHVQDLKYFWIYDYTHLNKHEKNVSQSLLLSCLQIKSDEYC